MPDQPARMMCGNDPRARLTDGDRQAVDAFRAYLAACATLNRVRAVLETEAVAGRSALEYRGLVAAALMADAPPADAVLAVLPTTGRAAWASAADHLAGIWQESVRTLAEDARRPGLLAAIEELRRMADETQPAAEARQGGAAS
jgi:hypothetical protein